MGMHRTDGTATHAGGRVDGGEIEEQHSLSDHSRGFALGYRFVHDELQHVVLVP